MKKGIVIAIVMIVVTVAIFLFNFINSPKNVDKYLKLGNEYLSENKYGEAITKFNNILKKEPDNIVAKVGLIEAYTALGKTSEAEEILKEALKNNDKAEDFFKQKYENSHNSSFKILIEKNIEGLGLIIVADVINISEEEAKNKLQGLNIIITNEIHDTITKGYIVSQSIAPGTEVEKGSDIVLVISEGIELIAVPNVTNMTITTAESLLKEFKTIVKYDYSKTIKKGYVISQSIKSGTKVEKDSYIELLVSDGINLYTIPDVRNMKEHEAVNLLKEFNIVTRNVYHDTIQKGIVISQSIKPGIKKEKGSNIEITISKGKQSITRVQIDTEILNLLPQEVGYIWSYTNGLYGNYRHKMQLKNILNNGNKIVYKVAGEVKYLADDGSSTAYVTETTYTIEEDKLIQHIEGDKLMDTIFYDLILIQGPLVKYSKWTQKVKANKWTEGINIGEEITLRCIIEGIMELEHVEEDNAKYYIVKYEDINSNYYEKRIIKEGVGVVRFERTRNTINPQDIIDYEFFEEMLYSKRGKNPFEKKV